MQASRRASAGTRASKSASKATCVHQHGGCGWPLARSASMAQPLAAPHSGQRLGSVAGAAVMWVVFWGPRRLRERFAAPKPFRSNP